MNETQRGKQAKRQLIQDELLICESELHDLMRTGHGKNKWVSVELSAIAHIELTWEEITLFFKHLEYLIPKLNKFRSEQIQAVITGGIKYIKATMPSPTTLQIKYPKGGFDKTILLSSMPDNKYQQEAIGFYDGPTAIRPNKISSIYVTLFNILPSFTITDANGNDNNLNNAEITVAFLESFLSNRKHILEETYRRDFEKLRIEMPASSRQPHDHMKTENEILVSDAMADKRCIPQETLEAILGDTLNTLSRHGTAIFFSSKIEIDKVNHRPTNIMINNRVRLQITEIETETEWESAYKSIVDSSTLGVQAAMMLMYELGNCLTFKVSLTTEKNDFGERKFSHTKVFLKTHNRC
jgi:hypothetical protein